MAVSVLKLIIVFRKSVIDIPLVKEYAQQFFEDYHRRKKLHCNVNLVVRNVDVDLIYQADLYEMDVALEYLECTNDFHPGHQFKKIGEDWCDTSKNRLSHFWLRLATRTALENKGKQSHSDVDMNEIAFGTFPSMQHFMQHYHYESKSSKKELMSTFLHNRRKKEKKEKENGEAEWCYKSKSLSSYQDYQSRRWERSLTFGCRCNNSYCHIVEIGKCLVLKVVVKKFRARGIIERLIQRCNSNTFFFYSNVETVFSKKRLAGFDTFPYNNELFNTIIDKNIVSDKIFACQFAWNVLNDLSAEVEDQIKLKYHTDNVIQHWENIRESLQHLTNIDALISTLYQISEMISRNEIFTFEDAFKKFYRHYRRNPSKLDPPEGMCFVRRYIITPSRLICLPPSEHFDNRVIREYGPENLLRVSIQDDNFSKLTFAVQHHSRRNDFMNEVAGDLLNDNIQIGPRCYEVLAASNSQLREHGLWMFAKDHEGNTAATIRNWMGDFSHIKNVAKFMARMGQCFSTSEEAVQIELDDEDVITIPDIKNNKYVFSDGVGMLSKELCSQVRKQLNKRLSNRFDETEPNYNPSAFQIRFKGCKGMVAENPSLRGNKLAIRPSMEKFSCDSSNLLEIVKISAPRVLFLNRPLISILEQLGVEINVFLKLQKDMVLDLTDSLIYEKKAWKMMSNLTTLDYPYKKLLTAGISLTQEPIFRSLLLSVYKVAIDQLRSKARIAIPSQYGRNMLGVIDETNTLKYGQIFVQYSEVLGNKESHTEVLKGIVVVTKNPCMHPGDVRKLEAVDVPALHHIKDCIVFPGSDLDGDEYVVIWYDPLIFPDENCAPMDYPPNPEKKHKKGQ
ncbi:RNA-dependent RNA polymerase 1 [Caerostris extrusa]|uniref:RNA-dependent RNA polymerase n=1 Tax=Caerostris extrusa TaxID=172846 RepID=A0AAV4PT55_CAEEX|nr:RNA-dependent RNA polymerase 1 [Caerostris extrusa]